jgi:hypothetical protein
VAVGFAIVALIAGTARTSYAAPPVLLDTITVSNYGSAFGGTLNTYLAGSGKSSSPAFFIKGTNTLLGSGTGPAGDAVSSLDHDIGVTVPIDLIDLTGFGGFPGALACTAPGKAGKLPIPCCTGFHTAVCGPGTGFAEIFAAGSNGNTTAESVIGTRNTTIGSSFCIDDDNPAPCCTGPGVGTCSPNISGVNTPQGIAYESPFDGRHPGKDIVAITNTLPFILQGSDGLTGATGGAACNAFATAACTGLGTPISCCTGVGAGTCAGFTLGTITEFDTGALATGTPGFNDGVAPFNNHPGLGCTGAPTSVSEIANNDGTCSACIAPAKVVNGVCNNPTTPTTVPSLMPPFETANATIAGCLTFLLGPVGDAFDETGFLFVVNEAAVSAGGPGFVTVYNPGASGDAYPAAIIGLLPAIIGGNTPAGTFKDPAYVTIASDIDFTDDVMFVTDVGDNSIKVFSVFDHLSPVAFVFTGTQLGTIKGGSTKLKRPEGIAVNVADGALYVVNDANNSVSMFTDFAADEMGGNIPPTLILAGKSTKLNFPVGVALPAFTPSVIPIGSSD